MTTTRLLLCVLIVVVVFLIVSSSANVVVDQNLRIDCNPDPNFDEAACRARGCLWGPVYDKLDPSIPWCHFPAGTGYVAHNIGHNRFRLTRAPKSVKNPFGGDTLDSTFEARSIGAGVRVTIGADESFVPDLAINTSPQIESNEQLHIKTFEADGVFAFIVERDNGVKLWDTSIGGLIISKQYLQLATLLPTDLIYGFGEHAHETLKHNTQVYKTWPMFARDQAPDARDRVTMNTYGVHNFYLALEADGKAHGVFVLNSNAQEVTIGPAPHITYRAIGGRFDIFFLPGPTPEQVVQQYMMIVGQPYMPSYWSLGFQYCKYGFKDLDDMKYAVKRITDAQIPFDVVYADIDYMDVYKDFSIDENKWHGLPEYISEIRKRDLHFTVITDPAIDVTYDVFERGIRKGARFISWPRTDLVPRDVQDKYPLARNTNIMLGVVWPANHAAFPDFYDDTNTTHDWWIDEIVRFQSKVGFEGLWIDMNEPSSMCTNDANCHDNLVPLQCPTSGDDAALDVPPFRTQAAYLYGDNAPLAQNTLCMFASVNNGKQKFYDVKNLYGVMEHRATHAAMRKATKQRGQIISRSTFPTTGSVGGMWLGDTFSDWPWLKNAVIGIQEFNIFAIPVVGSDVCGFRGSTNEELCLRWQQLGALQSFYRNHNDKGSEDQNPTRWPSVAATTRTANLWRYRHLPFLHSLHFAATLRGGTVIRPVFFEFPRDAETYNLSFEYMWGSSLLVAPVVEPDVDEITIYLPQAANWYALYGSRYGRDASPGHSIVEAPRNSSAPVFVRGGSIVPRQEPALTAMATHKNNFELLIAVDSTTNSQQKANGELYWDDGVSLLADTIEATAFYHFQYSLNITDKYGEIEIKLSRNTDTRLSLPLLVEIEVLGYPKAVSLIGRRHEGFEKCADFYALLDVTVNNKSARLSTRESNYDAESRILRLRRAAGLVKLNEQLKMWTIRLPHRRNQQQL